MGEVIPPPLLIISSKNPLKWTIPEPANEDEIIADGPWCLDYENEVDESSVEERGERREGREERRENI